MHGKGFTVKGRLLLIFFVIVLLGEAYYLLVHRRVDAIVSDARMRSETAMANYQIETAKAVKKQNMQEQTKTAKEGGAKQLPEFDNSVNVIAYLNQVMAVTGEYSLSFGKVEQGDYVVLRPVNMGFSCPNYDAVKDIVAQLENGPYFCEVTGLAMAARGSNGGDVTGETVSVQMTAVFYEYAGDMPVPAEETGAGAA